LNTKKAPENVLPAEKIDFRVFDNLDVSCFSLSRFVWMMQIARALYRIVAYKPFKLLALGQLTAKAKI